MLLKSLELYRVESICIFALSEDVDRKDLVPLDNFVHHLHSFNNPTENRMLFIEPRSGDMGDEKLTAVGGRTSIGHGEDSGTAVFQFGVKLSCAKNILFLEMVRFMMKK